MAKNVVAAQVNTSIMEGTKATYSVDIRDYLGAEVDSSLVMLRCALDGVPDFALTWSEEYGVHVLTIPELDAGRYSYEIYQVQETGEHVVMVQGIIGVFAAESWQEPVVSTSSPNRTLHVRLADERGQIEATWIATAAAEGYAYEAKKWAEALKNAMPLLEAAKAFMESFDEALKEAIQIRDNYLWIGGVNTGYYLRGDDGVTPTYGSDGYWYIGEKRVGKARGDDGITPYITTTGFWAIGEVVTNVRAAGRDGIDGASMKRIRINSLDELPEQEERGVYYYLKTDSGWDKYVWLHPDGWVCVGEVNDIATSEIYGLMKYATDAQVDNGAPVGTNAEGQASVPLASTTVAGAGRLSASIEITFGAEVGFDANKAYRVPVATMDSYGVGRLGINTTVDGAYVGFDSNGRWCVPWATLYTAGAIKLGSQYGQSNPMPYIVGIGATENHELANNYAFGGALQHRKPDGWRGTMAWLDDSMSQSQQYFGDMFYSGLLTSEQFSQSQNNGLELLPATTSRLAGVYLAESMNQTGPYALTGDVVVNYLSEHYYGKSQVYTKQETLTQLQTKLNGYVSLSWAQDNLMTKTQIMDELRKKIGCPSGKIENFEAIPASERGEMSAVDAKTFTIVYAG